MLFAVNGEIGGYAIIIASNIIASNPYFFLLRLFTFDSVQFTSKPFAELPYIHALEKLCGYAIADEKQNQPRCV